MLGTHLVKHWSNTPSVVALSGAEAELYGVVRGATQGIGLQSIARDQGETLDLEVLTDSSAAMGVCMRKGIGRVRHLDTNLLWVDDKDFTECRPNKTHPPLVLFLVLRQPPQSVSV